MVQHAWRWLLALAFTLGLVPLVSANQAATGFCTVGNQPVVVSGLTSTNVVQGSFPQCIVTVNVVGGGLATIFADNIGTPLANPFTATSGGQWTFYAANGRYSVTLSGFPIGTTPTSVTFSDILLFDPATGTIPFTNLSLSGTLSVVGASTLSGGGSLAGTFSGSPIFSGSPTFSSATAFNGLATFSAGMTGTGNIGALDLGPGALAATHTWSGTQNFAIVVASGAAAFTDGLTANGIGAELWVGSGSGEYSTIAAAYTALPSCTIANDFDPFTGNAYQSLTWPHCGTIHISQGSFTVSSQITIQSPWVHIVGSDNGDTILNWTGTIGCAIYWGANWINGGTPNQSEWVQGADLENVRIDGGQSNTGGTCGLQTDGMSQFRMRNVTIANFNGSGSSCWLDSAEASPVATWNEKYDVDVTLDNCATDWHVYNEGTSGGPTMGYGRFFVKMALFNGQSGWVLDGGTPAALGFENSNLTIEINGESTAVTNDIVLENGATFFNNTGVIHDEAGQGSGSVGVNLCSTCTFFFVGWFDQYSPSTNVISNIGQFETFAPPDTYFNSASGTSFGIFHNTTQSAGGSATVHGIHENALYTGTTSETGSMTALFGEDQQNGTGGMYEMDGVGGQVVVNNSGGLTNAVAFDAANPAVGGGGSITNAYGLYIRQQKSSGITNGYGVYQAGNDPNVLGGYLQSPQYLTASNCSSSASPAVCGSAAAGSVVVAAAATTVVVDTTAVTANSQIILTPDSSLGTKLSVTCNTTAGLLDLSPWVSARSAGTSFTITLDGAPSTNPECLSYVIIN